MKGETILGDWDKYVDLKPIDSISPEEFGTIYADAVYEERGGHTMFSALGTDEEVYKNLVARGKTLAVKIPKDTPGAWVTWSRRQNKPIGLHFSYNYALHQEMTKEQPFFAPYDAIVPAIVKASEEEDLLPKNRGVNDLLFRVMMCTKPSAMKGEKFSKIESNKLTMWLTAVSLHNSFQQYPHTIGFVSHPKIQTFVETCDSISNDKGCKNETFRIDYADLNNVGPIQKVDGEVLVQMYGQCDSIFYKSMQGSKEILEMVYGESAF